jgi:hypothetical protein
MSETTSGIFISLFRMSLLSRGPFAENMALESIVSVVQWITGGTLLCALVVILVVEGLQYAVAADDPIASQVEFVDLVIPKNVIVVEPPKKPEAGVISADSLNL